MIVKKAMKTIIYRFLSVRVTHLFRRIKVILLGRNALCLPNAGFKDIHKGQRCFILCNGPSVSKQDLIPLRGETTFSVSSGYLHEDYNTFRPKYHCVPGISYSASFGAQEAVSWFKEMDRRVGEAELFLDSAEEPLVRKNNLFPEKKVNYLCMAARFSSKFTEFDLSGIIPSPQSVSIMCLMTAIYMGFKNIYLIGTEHDSAITGEYIYFFTPELSQKENPDVSSDGKIKNLESERQSFKKLIEQYRILKSVAENKGIAIYNATLGGALEVFPRVNLAELFKAKK